MWVLRLLSGPTAGKTLPLPLGVHMLGRSPQCSIQVSATGISKEHLRIEVTDNKVTLKDNNSSNGTFVNGVQIRVHTLKPKDKVRVHDLFFEITNVGHAWPEARSEVRPDSRPGERFDSRSTAASAPPPENWSPPQSPSVPPKEFKEKFDRYVDEVLLPGVYKLPEWIEFRWVIGLFVIGFIFVVTSLSTIPLLRILKASVEGESQQHALSIAHNLAQMNLSALMQGTESAVSVGFAQRRPGVKEALIISNLDGHVIAPTNRSGTFPDIPFVHEARKGRVEAVAQVDSSTVVAMVPIEFFNVETGSQAVTAFAVVMYDMGAIAVDDGKTISLFIQTLFIAVLVGFVLFYFLYKMIEFPIKDLNSQLDRSLKEGRDEVHTKYLFTALQSLATNITSSLNRTNANGQQQNQFIEYDRAQEMSHIVELIGFPAMAIHGTLQQVLAVNAAFEEKIGQGAELLISNSFERINDQALKLSLADLLQKAQISVDALHTNELEFNGESHQVALQAVYGTNQVAYYLVVLLPNDGGG